MKDVVRALCVHQTETLEWDAVTNFDRLEKMSNELVQTTKREMKSREGGLIYIYRERAREERKI